MKVAVFSTKPYDRQFLEIANTDYGHALTFFESRLNHDTSTLAAGFAAVCVFVNDQLDASVLSKLAREGTRLIALRCAGFNNVDLSAAQEVGLIVVRVPVYSPYAVAEHTVALILAVNRRIHRAYNRVREGNFVLDGLLGFELQGRTVGVVGTGKIGALALDVYEEEADLFFEDLSNRVIQDDIFARLLTFPNVIITGHQAFFTQNALENIAKTTLSNITDFEHGRISPENVVKAEHFIR